MGSGGRYLEAVQRSGDSTNPTTRLTVRSGQKAKITFKELGLVANLEALDRPLKVDTQPLPISIARPVSGVMADKEPPASIVWSDPKPHGTLWLLPCMLPQQTYYIEADRQLSRRSPPFVTSTRRSSELISRARWGRGQCRATRRKLWLLVFAP